MLRIMSNQLMITAVFAENWLLKHQTIIVCHLLETDAYCIYSERVVRWELPYLEDVVSVELIRVGVQHPVHASRIWCIFLM